MPEEVMSEAVMQESPELGEVQDHPIIEQVLTVIQQDPTQLDRLVSRLVEIVQPVGGDVPAEPITPVAAPEAMADAPPPPALPVVEEEIAATQVAAAPPVGAPPETPAQIRAQIPITPGDIRKRTREVAAKYGAV